MNNPRNETLVPFQDGRVSRGLTPSDNLPRVAGSPDVRSAWGEAMKRLIDTVGAGLLLLLLSPLLLILALVVRIGSPGEIFYRW